MPTIRNEKLELTSLPKLRPSLLSGSSSGRIRTGTGSINTPQIASPGYLQYIPQPTQLGQQVGQDIANIADKATQYALKLAIQESKTKTTIDAANDSSEAWAYLLGTEKQPGMMSLQNKDYVEVYENIITYVDNLVEEKSNAYENSLDKSFYSQQMLQYAKVIKTAARNKYKTEAASAKKVADETAHGENVTNAVRLAHDPHALAAILQKGTLELVGQGLSAPLADAKIKSDVTEAILALEGGRDIYKNLYNKGLFATSAEGMIAIQNHLANSMKQEITKINYDKAIDDENSRLYFKEQSKGIMSAFLSATDETQLANIYRQLYEASFDADPSGDTATDIKNMYEALKTEIPLSGEAAITVEQAYATDVNPFALNNQAIADGVKIPGSTLKAYAHDYFKNINSKIDRHVSQAKEQLKLVLNTQKGISLGGAEFFMTSPKGIEWLDKMINENLRPALRAAYMDKTGGFKAAQAATDQFKLMITDPNVLVSKYNEVTREAIDNLPHNISPIKQLSMITQGQIDPLKLKDTLPTQWTPYDLNGVLVELGASPANLEIRAEADGYEGINYRAAYMLELITGKIDAMEISSSQKALYKQEALRQYKWIVSSYRSQDNLPIGLPPQEGEPKKSGKSGKSETPKNPSKNNDLYDELIKRLQELNPNIFKEATSNE